MPSRNHIKFNISFPTMILDENSLEIYLLELEKYKNHIRDINVAARVPPMIIDAHGIEMAEEKNIEFLKQLEYIQNYSGIPVSLTLNNIYVPNDKVSYNKFIESYKPYYERGFRHLTLPHLLWLDYGFKVEFPDTDVKITTLRKINTAQDFWNYAISGFDLVNIDRRLQRNHNELSQIYNAQQKAYDKLGRKTEISIICNESCVGTCRYFDEHYLFMMVKSQFDSSERLMPHYSCSEYPDYSLRRFNVLGLAENINELCQYIDVIKLAGRRAEKRFLTQPFEFIEWFFGDKIEYPAVLAPIYFKKRENEIKLVNEWSKIINTCNFQCWNCSICDKLEDILSKYYKMLPNRRKTNAEPNLK